MFFPTVDLTNVCEKQEELEELVELEESVEPSE